MRHLNRFWTLTILFSLLSSLIVLTIPPTTAQAGCKPSVPQFTVKLIDTSYDVPPSSTTTVDQYTGKETTTTIPGYHVDQKSIEVTIKNQPFTPYTNENSKEINLYYIVHVKGHFGEDWKIFGHVQDFGSYTSVSTSPYTVQSNSEYTVMMSVANYATESQLDFKVKADIGYLYNSYEDRLIPPWFLVSVETSSDWSRVQTFTVSDRPVGSAVPSQTPSLSPPPVISDDNSSPSQSPEYVIFTHPFFLLGVGILLGVIVMAVVMVILKQHLKTSTYPNDSLCQTLRGKGLYV